MSPALSESCSHESRTFVLSTVVRPPGPSSVPDTCVLTAYVLGEWMSMTACSACQLRVGIPVCYGGPALGITQSLLLGTFISFMWYILRYRKGWDVASLFARGNPEAYKQTNKLMDLEKCCSWFHLLTSISLWNSLCPHNTFVIIYCISVDLIFSFCL